MATYQVTIPNKGTFEVSSDRELTDAEVYNYALEQVKADAPEEGLSASEVAYGAVTNFPSSLGNVAKDIFTAITSPIDTAFGLAGLVTGTVQTAGLKAGEALLPEGKTKDDVMSWMQQDGKAIEMSSSVADFYADRYGSLEGFKKAVATDPASVMADAATVFSGGSMAGTKLGIPLRATEAMTKAASYVDPIMLTGRTALAGAKGAGIGVKQGTGLATGAGAEAVEQAYRSGVEGGDSARSFRGAMRGEIPISEILDIAKQNLLNMKISKNAKYKESLAALKTNDKIISFSGIDKALNTALDMVTYKGTVKNRSGHNAVIESKNLIEQWKLKDPKEFHTPEGIDALKQQVYSIVESIPFEQSQARMAANKISLSIGEEIRKQAPSYARMMKEYSDSSSLIKEIERALSIGDKAAADTGIRKLQSLMRNNANTNYGSRLDLAKTLEQQGGGQIMPLAAGQSLSNWSPRGIQGAVTPVGGIGAYSVAGLPAVAGYAAASSPRLVGEVAHATGRAAGGISKATQGILGMIPDVNMQQALNLMYQSQQPKEQQ